MNEKFNKGKLMLIAIIPLMAIVILIAVLGNRVNVNHNTNITNIGDVKVEMTTKENNSSLEKLSASSNVPYAIGVKNAGENDAYVFMTITVPYDADTQRLAYFSNTAGITSEWKLVSVGIVDNKGISDVSNIKNKSDAHAAMSENTITYVYGYIGDNKDGTLKALAPDAKTSNIFDYVKLENGSSMASMTSDCEFITNIYAIQTTEYDNDAILINDGWAVVNKAIVNAK